jgi:hypothetical protein
MRFFKKGITMSFTSPSVANKNNKFHVGPVGPEHYIYVIMQESIVFNILQRAMLLLPTVPLSLSYQLPTEVQPTTIECINAERLISSCYKLDEHILTKNIPRAPKKIISCSIGNIVLKKKLIPCQSNDRALAIAIYNYSIKLQYIDSFGKSFTIDLTSRTRYQRAFLNNISGHLEVKLNIECIHANICPNLSYIAPVPKKASQHKPVHVWLKSK